MSGKVKFKVWDKRNNEWLNRFHHDKYGWVYGEPDACSTLEHCIEKECFDVFLNGVPIDKITQIISDMTEALKVVKRWMPKNPVRHDQKVILQKINDAFEKAKSDTH